MQGFIDHEVGHVLFTDFNHKKVELSKDKLLMAMTNIIEDPLVERLIGEKFPGDEQNGQMLRAGVKLPEKLLTHPALTVPAIKSPAQPAAKPTVRPALPAQVSPSKPQPIVKPALDTAPGLDKPRNQ